MADKAQAAARFLQSLANGHRLMVLCTLIEGERSVSELLARLGTGPSNLSQHLGRLRQEGLITARRDGTTLYYRLADSRALPILQELYLLFCAPEPPRGTGAGGDR